MNNNTSRSHLQSLFNNSLAIRQEIQRFESVHPSIYAIYHLIDLLDDSQVASQIRDHVVCIEAGSCGQKKSIAQQLFFYGYRTMAGSWPWHGALFHRYEGLPEYACGVTVLSEQFVITAAHCMVDKTDKQWIPAHRVFVKLGITNLNKPEWYTQEHNVNKIIVHEEYDDRVIENDIALLRLSSKITYTSYVQPICLSKGDASLSRIVKKVGYSVGWGLDENNMYSSDLIEATFPIVSKKTCINSDTNHYDKLYHESKTFCAGYRNGTSAGPGDSGSGLFLRKGSNWFLRGLISSAKTNPETYKIDTESFVLFTDVTFYRDWIKRHVTISTSDEIDPDLEPPPSRPDKTPLNLLGLQTCGKDSYALGTPEEFKKALDQYPWLAVIEFIDMRTLVLEDVCHGILIHPKFILTAAHCIERKTHSTLRSIRLNNYRLDTITDIRSSFERIFVKAASSHPTYNSPRFAHNIALLKLERSTTMAPICLPPKGSSLPTASSNLFSVIGWKRNNRREKPLIRNVVQLADFEACRRRYRRANVMLDTSGGQLCSTYNHEDDDGSCSHYLGSAPFQYVVDGPTEGRYYLAAFSNFGHYNCRMDKYPDVFTYVGHYLDWIYDKVSTNQ